ncbi:hypothetical protein PR003_g22900 [Phytophthora rubi]|uniref:Uncharacterized protein n=1 Tax=Phytophthora rubi TaxID=129364 RepID=A0A6A3GUM8_9STRA|nr:hypothetical protein PR002_g30289 [Phytophthora rubi]KAE8960779.1 hypothetical protein PR001_g30269 [Phytophthora rubi]KAE9299807.1 hypothetical protein PR003_g22900 [Phytophthora rubi]
MNKSFCFCFTHSSAAGTVAGSPSVWAASVHKSRYSVARPFQCCAMTAFALVDRDCGLK